MINISFTLNGQLHTINYDETRVDQDSCGIFTTHTRAKGLEALAIVARCQLHIHRSTDGEYWWATEVQSTWHLKQVRCGKAFPRAPRGFGVDNGKFFCPSLESLILEVIRRNRYAEVVATLDGGYIVEVPE